MLERAFRLVTKEEGRETAATVVAARSALGIVMGAREPGEGGRGFVSERPEMLTETDPLKIFFGFVEWLVWRGWRSEAATCLWPEAMFTAEPRSVRKIWDALDEANFVSLLGASGQGKSFSPLVYFLIEWLADPNGTRVDLVSTNEDKLNSAVYAKLVGLHRGASLTLPGEAKASTLSCDTRAGFGFYCRLIKQGEVNSGELKGAHRTGRETPHPAYGVSTRRFVLIDEAQQVNENVFSQIPNVLASGDSAGSVKVVMTANPADMATQYGNNCQPVGGWDEVLGEGPDVPDEWTSRTGARCVRLDVRKSENYLAKREIFQNFQTWEGAQAMLAQCGGDMQHPDMWTYVYGNFPPAGPMSSLIPARWVRNGEWQFETMTDALAGLDPATTGDEPAMAHGRAGRAVGWKDLDTGKVTMLPQPTWVIQLDGVTAVNQGDPQQVADGYMARLKQIGVQPECTAIDFTGDQSVGSTIRYQWRQKVGVVKGQEGMSGPVDVVQLRYSTVADDRRISVEDTLTALHTCANKASELWVRMAKFYELGLILHGRGVDLETVKQLTTRKAGRSVTNASKIRVEPKDAHKRRLGGKSPDRADSVSALCDAASRSVSGLVIKAKDTEMPKEPVVREQKSFVNEHGWREIPVEVNGFEAGGDVENLGKEPETQQEETADAWPAGLPWEF